MKQLYQPLEYHSQPRRQRILELIWKQPQILKEKKMEREITTTFKLPIGDVYGQYSMKNIPSLALPSFQGTTFENPNIFLFEFDVQRRSYDYTTNAQKLKLFLATMKGDALRWFMGLRGASISLWDDMKKTFLEKHQDYH